MHTAKTAAAVPVKRLQLACTQQLGPLTAGDWQPRLTGHKALSEFIPYNTYSVLLYNLWLYYTMLWYASL